MAKTKRNWIELTYANTGSLRAEDIPYDGSSSIKTIIDGKASTTGITGNSWVIDSDGNAGASAVGVYFGPSGNSVTKASTGEMFFVSSANTYIFGGSSDITLNTTSGSVSATSFSGSGASLTSLNATNISSGTVANARLDSNLAAIGNNATNGIYARTGTGTVAARTITGSGSDITVTNGNGVSGNPTISAGSNLAKLASANTFATGQVQTLDSLNFTKVWQQINASESTTARFDFDFQRGSTSNADRYFYWGIATNTGTGVLRTIWYKGDGGSTNQAMVLDHKTPLLRLNGNLQLGHSTSNLLDFNTVGVAAPGAASAGMKIRLYALGGMGSAVTANDYGFGVAGGVLWANSDQDFKWYSDSVLKLTLDSAGYIQPAGGYKSTTSAPGVNGSFFDSNGTEFVFEDGLLTGVI